MGNKLSASDQNESMSPNIPMPGAFFNVLPSASCWERNSFVVTFIVVFSTAKTSTNVSTFGGLRENHFGQNSKIKPWIVCSQLTKTLISRSCSSTFVFVNEWQWQKATAVRTGCGRAIKILRFPPEARLVESSRPSNAHLELIKNFGKARHELILKVTREV